MTELNKRLTLYGLTMIAVGSCIGSGIFVTPGEIAQQLPHAGFIVLVWVIGGLFALTGTLTFAELGAMFPKAGGVYIFLREAFGPWAAFFYGWMVLLVITSGAIAALGVAFAKYLTFFIPGLEGTGQTLVAMFTIIGLTLLNVRGVQVGQTLSNVFSGLKLLAIAGIIVAGFVFFDPSKVDLQFNLQEEVPTNLYSALLVALIGVLWSYGGWHHATYLAGEAINPQRTVPRAMVLGAVVVTAAYVLANLGYMFLLPIDQIAATERVAGEAIATLIPWGGKLVAVGIAISIFGTIGIYTMSAPRIYYAMAQDKVFFAKLGELHPKFQTPATAMMVQMGWSVFLLFFWGTFNNLIEYVTFMDILFLGLAGAGVFVLRIRRPYLERPYKVWGYPVVPFIYTLICGAFVINTLIERPVQAWAGLALLAPGALAAWYFRRKNRPL